LKLGNREVTVEADNESTRKKKNVVGRIKKRINEERKTSFRSSILIKERMSGRTGVEDEELKKTCKPE